MYSRRLLPIVLALVVGLTSVASSVVLADELELKDGHPERYVVREGDTLWDISARFLVDPWRWPEIWKANPYIDNPHLIYPGDVLVFTNINGNPSLRVLRNENLAVEKLSPRIREEAVDDAITTIPPGVIEPFLTEGMVLDADAIDDLGYVVLGVEGNIVVGEGSEIYARNLVEPVSKVYQVFRPGDALIHPVTNEYLGTEATYLGDATMLRADDVSKLLVTRSVEEIAPSDRLLPVERDIAKPYFHPHAPEGDVLGYIIKAAKGVSEVGPYSIVIISLGLANGIEEGHVLRIRHNKAPIKDPVTGRQLELPEEDSGLLMVFKAFERVSYALVMDATRAIHVNDSLVSPLR
ncbi:MAG: hypothetical protein DHS20C01_03680 [marine bacterium B5-7]|nr:MAG: hypothetical protein DHS20C01_03680 [marine bacterium B5-7]